MSGIVTGIVVAVIAAVGAAVSTTLSVEAQRRNQRYLEMQMAYQQAVDKQNADLKAQQAQEAERRGEVAVSKQMRVLQQFKGRQRATLAAHGVDMSEGSPLDTLTGTDVAGAQDIQTLMHNAAMEAWGYKVEENNFKNDIARLDWEKQASRAQTKSNIRNTIITGVFSGLSSASSAFTSAYKPQAKPAGDTAPDYGVLANSEASLNIGGRNYYTQGWTANSILGRG